MKHCKWIFPALLVLILLIGCSRTPGATQPSPTEKPLTTTVMVYMVGSDLEAKAGSATKDLEEMAASGVDTSLVNLVVYAGGAPHWHNEVASVEEHRVLTLGTEGFTSVNAQPVSSMGESQCLSSFLNYAYTNFPADQYALILWDHGDGPVIGYGRDMLFDNDSLTLSEMRQALYNFTTTYDDIGVYGSVYLYSTYLAALAGDEVFNTFHRYWRASYSPSLSVPEALVNSVPMNIYNAIDQSITFPRDVVFNTPEEAWMSKLTLQFYLDLLDKEATDPEAFQVISGQDLLYNEINSAIIEGGGRIIIALSGDSYVIPADADKGLVYIGLDKDFNVVTSLIA